MTLADRLSVFKGVQATRCASFDLRRHVPGHTSGVPGGAPVLVGRRLRIALDDRVEGEYRDVLTRPRMGLEQVRREAFLAILQFQEHVTAMPWPHRRPPDEDDVVFLEVALQTPARTVVTGNLKHFPAGCRGPVTVMSPRAAWERFVGLGLT